MLTISAVHTGILLMHTIVFSNGKAPASKQDTLTAGANYIAKKDGSTSATTCDSLGCKGTKCSREQDQMKTQFAQKSTKAKRTQCEYDSTKNIQPLSFKRFDHSDLSERNW